MSDRRQRAGRSAIVTASVPGVICWLCVACSITPRLDPTGSAVVRRGDLVREVTFAGMLAFEETTSFVAPAPGAIFDRTLITEGMSVSAGTPLAQFKLNRLEYDLARRRAALRRAELTLEKRESGNDRIEIALARLDVDAARLEVSELESQSRQLLVRAPFDGTVLQVARPGMLIGPTQAAVVLGRGTTPVAEIELDEYEARLLRKAQPAKVLVPSFGKTFDGMVLRDPSLKRVRPGGSVFAALIGLNQPPSSPLAGLTCTVTVTLARAANVLIVPRRAIVMLDGRPHVAVRSSDCVRATAVVLGLSNEEFVEVTKGLEGDARIALGTEAELRDAITGR